MEGSFSRERRRLPNLGTGSESSSCPQLEDSPQDPGKHNPSLATRSTVSNVSHLHENYASTKSESVHSFESVSCKSESSYRRKPPSVLNVVEDKEESVSRQVPVRRTSCPSVITTNVLVFSHESANLVPPRRVLSLSSGDQIREQEVSRMTSQLRRERIKSSLSKLSATIASASRSIALSRGPAVLEASVEVSRMTQPDKSCAVVPDSPPETPRASRAGGHRRDSGCVIFDEELLAPADISHQSSSSLPSDLLSPNSPIKGTLRIHPPQPPVATPVFPPLAPSRALTGGPSSGNINTLHQQTFSQFIPSLIGKELMGVFHANGSQETMWGSFLEKAKSPLEYADSVQKMPSVLYCLRGLIRFGNGDHGVSKPDILPLLFHIMTGRHAVCETSAFVEAAECAACVLSMLAINPVSRQGMIFSDLSSRPRFEPLMTTQNAVLFQQIFAVLSQHIARWISVEGSRDPSLKLTSRGVSALLEILYVYCVNKKLIASWMGPAPDSFKRSIPNLIISLAQRLPSTVAKCMHILDAVLDQVPCDSATCRQIAHGIHNILRLASSPEAGEARSVLSRWAGGMHRKHRGISALFKTWTSGNKSSTTQISASNKNTVYIEYSRIAN